MHGDSCTHGFSWGWGTHRRVGWLSVKENSLVHESSPPLQHNVPTWVLVCGETLHNQKETKAPPEKKKKGEYEEPNGKTHIQENKRTT